MVVTGHMFININQWDGNIAGKLKESILGEESSRIHSQSRTGNRRWCHPQTAFIRDRRRRCSSRHPGLVVAVRLL